MKIELTPKEIKGIGFNRYFTERKRDWKAIGLFFIGIVCAGIFTVFTEGRINGVLQFVLAIVILLAGMSYWFVSLWRAEKVGEKFLEQWQKEGGK